MEYATSTPELLDYVSDLDLERLVILVEAQGLGCQRAQRGVAQGASRETREVTSEVS